MSCLGLAPVACYSGLPTQNSGPGGNATASADPNAPDDPNDPSNGASTGGGGAGSDGGAGPGGGTDPSADTDGSQGDPPLLPQPVTKLLRVSNEEYRNIVGDVLGFEFDRQLFAAWPPVAAAYGFDTMSEQPVDGTTLDEHLKTTETITELALGSATVTAVCPGPVTPTPSQGTALTWDNCGAPLVTRLAGRAFRRPLHADEITDYKVFFDASVAAATKAAIPHPFYEGLFAVVHSVLLSPNLFFKPELVPGGFAPSEQHYRIASRLGLFFRSSVPDDELVSLAEKGKLGDRAVILEQAQRLLAADQPRFTRNFAGQWLGFRDSLPNPNDLLLSMQAEVGQVFSEVLSSGAPPSALMAPGFTVVDRRLAQHYGLPFDAGGPAIARIPSDTRGGLLSQGYFLTRTASGSDFKRPIHRGIWTLSRLLCQTLPMVNAATLEEIAAAVKAIDPSLPLPERMALHRKSQTRCGSCHNKIDPIGLALEKYDAAGLWRDTYEDGTPIVSDLTLFGADVGDPAALATAIRGSAEYRGCVSQTLLTYAMNRGPLPEEQSAIDDLTGPSEGKQPSLESLVVSAFVKSIDLTEVAP